MKKKNILLKIIFCVLFLTVFFYTALRFVQIYKKGKFLNSLSKAVEEEAQGKGIEYAFLFKDLDSPGTEFCFNEKEKFVAASLIKLPILAVALNAAKEGKISLTDELVVIRKDITGGSGKLKAMNLPYELTIEKTLEMMISISDNTATNKIIDLLGSKRVNDGFNMLGLDGTSLSRKIMDFSMRRKGFENYTSAYDISFLLEMIYNRNLVDADSSVLALSFLKTQKVNDRIPRYLPKDVVVAHKTGLEKGVVHDAGIVFTLKGDYIICVLVGNAKSYKEAKKFIAQVSLLTYNLYNTFN